MLGALVASLIVGLGQAIGVLLAPEFSATLIYVILAAVMIFRPNGLFGKRASL